MRTSKLVSGGLALLLLASTSCTVPSGGVQGVLQPQSTTGACVVKKFFLVRLSSTPTDMTVDANSPGCQFTLINPDLQIVNDGALVTTKPAHGIATATLVEQGRSVSVSYAPSQGYVGPDRFEVTVQPLARAAMFTVTVQAAKHTN